MGVPFSSAFAIHGYIGWLYCLHSVMFRSMVRQLIRFGYMVGCSWLYWFVLLVIFGCARAISPGLNGKRVTKRSSRHTQNSVASLRAEIRDTGEKTCTRTADYGTTPSS